MTLEDTSSDSGTEGLSPLEETPLAPEVPEPKKEDRYVLPKPLLHALIGTENPKKDPNARSPKGAFGLTQVMPDMWSAYKGGDTSDPEEQVYIGSAIFKDELDRFGGNVSLAAAAYNAGSPHVIRALKESGHSLADASKVGFEKISPYLKHKDGSPLTETQLYVPRFMSLLHQEVDKTPDTTNTGVESPHVPSPFDPNNVGTKDYLKKKFDTLAADPAMATNTATENQKNLINIWNSKPYWSEDSKATFKKLSTNIWDTAMPDEAIDFHTLIGEPPVIQGKTDSERNKELNAWKASKIKELTDMGINSTFLGDQLDTYFKESGESEKKAADYRQRSMLSSVLGYVPNAAVEALAKGEEALGSELAAIPRLVGAEDVATGIEHLVSKVTPESRRGLAYEVDDIGRLVADEYGQPVGTLTGTVSGAVGAVGEFFAGGEVLKLLKAPKYALTAYGISTGALLGANSAYQDAINNGGNRQQALLASVYSLPENTIDSLVNLHILAGNKVWLKGAGKLEKARALAWQFGKQGSIGGSVNGLRQYLQDLGVSAAIDKDITSGRRVFDQTLGGFIAAGAFGARDTEFAVKDPNLRPVKGGGGEPPPTGKPKVTLPSELPKKAEQEKIVSFLEDFKKSSATTVEHPIRAEVDADPEMLAAYGVKGELLQNGNMRFTKETTFAPGDVDALTTGALDVETKTVSFELVSKPTEHARESLAARKQELDTQIKELSPENLSQARSVEEVLAKIDKTKRQIKTLEALNPEDPKDRKLLNTNISVFKKTLSDLQLSVPEDAPGVREAKMLREHNDVSNTLKEMQDPRYTNNESAKDNYLKHLVAKKNTETLEAAKPEGPETSKKPTAPEAPKGIEIDTPTGKHYVDNVGDAWHIKDANGALVSGSHATYKEAFDWARDNLKRVEPEPAKGAPNRFTISERHGELEKQTKAWDAKTKSAAQDAIVNQKEFEYLSKKIKDSEALAKSGKKPKGGASYEEQRAKYQEDLDELKPMLADNYPGVKEARVLKEKKTAAELIKKKGSLTDKDIKEAYKEAMPEMPEGVEASAPEGPRLTRQPTKDPAVPLDDSFTPGEKIIAGSTKEANPRDIIKGINNALKSLTKYLRQEVTGKRDPNSKRTPEEAARLQKGFAYSLREAGRGIRNAGGFIDYLKRFIRVDGVNDIQTAFHELAHAINTELFPEWKNFPQAVQQGLVKMGRTFYKAGVDAKGKLKYDSYPVNKKLNEGWATFMEHYTNGMPVQKDVLDFYNGWVKENYPDLHTSLEALKEKNFDFYRMDPYTYAKVFTGAKSAAYLKTASDARTFQDIWKDDLQIMKELDAATEGKFRFYDIMESERGRTNEMSHNMAHGEGELKGFNNDAIPGSTTAREAIEQAQASKKLPKLVAYMVAKRTLVLGSEAGGKRRSGFSVEDAQKIVHDVEHGNRDSEVLDSASKVWDWYLNVLTIAGERSPSMGEKVKKFIDYNLNATKTPEAGGVPHGFYAPFSREMEAAVAPAGKEGRGASNPLYGFKGSDRRIKNFLLDFEDHARGLLDAANKDYMWDKIIGASKTSPLGAYVTEVPRSMVPKLELKLQEAIEAANIARSKKGKPTIKLDEASKEYLEDTVTIFRPEIVPPRAADGYMTIARKDEKGQLKFYEVNPRIAKAISAEMPDFTQSPWFKWAFTYPGRVMRVGATTARMAYQLRNLVFRDFATAYRSQKDWNPLPLLKEVMSSFGSHFLHSVTNGKYTSPLLEMEKGLGIYNATRAGAAREIEQQIERDSGKKVIGVMEKSFSWLENVLSAGESATRSAALKLKAKELGITDFNQKLTPEQTIELILAKKRSTTNFQIQGSDARVINQMVPFFTARIAELSRLPRDWKENPQKQLGFAAGYLALGIATAIANKDEKWFQNLEPEEKMVNWVTDYTDSQGNNRILKVPLETLAGAAHGIGLLIGEQMSRNDVLKASLPENAWGLLKNYLPITHVIDILGVPGKEAAQQLSNYDYFFKKDIVPKSLENAPAHVQFTAATTELSKTIAQSFHRVGLDWSPVRIDHALRGVFPAGIDMIKAVESYTGVKPINENSASVADIALNMFSRSGYEEGTMDRSTREFYSASDKFTRNKDIETDEEGAARKKLDKIKESVGSINVMLSVVTDPEERKEMYTKKRELLEQGIAISKGDTETTVAPSEYKGTAKQERQRRKAERAEKLQQTKETSLFE